MKITIFVPASLEGTGFLKGGYQVSVHDNFGLSSEHLTVVITRVTIVHDGGVIGLLHDSATTGRDDNCSVRFWIEMESGCTLRVKKVILDGISLQLDRVIIVVYSASDILHSEVIYSKVNLQKKPLEECVSFFIHEVCRSEAPFRYCSPAWGLYTFTLILGLISSVLCVPLRVAEGVKGILVRGLKVRHPSTFLDQLILRLNLFKILHRNLKQDGRISLLSGRLLTALLVDILLGTGIVWWIKSSPRNSNLYIYFDEAARFIASQVQMLLSWLKGAPAGLKLNQPLTQALSSFFSYHVYLWTLYLDVAAPLLKVCGYVFTSMGVLGISLQIAALSDLLNMATFHIHCFYVYAARIHMVQVSLLGSQWRAFRGVKWNPLKERVDSVDEGQQRPLSQVLTTVVFTLVVFLLPTTTAYYFVFMMLRLCLYMMCGLLSCLVWLLNFNPVYLWWKCYVESPSVRGEVFFETKMESHEERARTVNPICIQVRSWPSPFSRVELHARDEHCAALTCPNFGAILRSLLYARELL